MVQLLTVDLEDMVLFHTPMEIYEEMEGIVDKMTEDGHSYIAIEEFLRRHYPQYIK